MLPRRHRQNTEIEVCFGLTQQSLNQGIVDSIRDNISGLIEMPVILEFSIIPETVVRSTDVFEASE